jgi:hypothetical protein
MAHPLKLLKSLLPNMKRKPKICGFTRRGSRFIVKKLDEITRGQIMLPYPNIDPVMANLLLVESISPFAGMDSSMF